MTDVEPITGQQSNNNDSLNPKSNTGRGGARSGAGRPKGSKEPHTIEREAIKKEFEDRIHRNAESLLNAALNKARGETFLMCKVTERDSKGKVLRVYHETVTNPNTIIEYLDGELEGGDSIDTDENYYYMSTKPVDVNALKDLFDRAFGRPSQKVENSGEQKLIIETRRHTSNRSNGDGNSDD
jgi:hypothetical protein